MAMTISNWEGTADTFTWPHNPQTHDDAAESNHTNQQIGYQSHHIITTGGGILPRNIILTGHMDGTDKRSDFEDMTKHFFETTKLKKLFFQSDKFALGIGRGAKETDTGGRTNFIDYVARFETIIGILFGSTAKTSGTNGGNISTFVTSIVGDYDGTGDVTMSDGTNTITVPSTEFSGTEEVIFNFVKLVDSGNGILVTQYPYVTIDGTETENVKVTGGNGVLKLSPGTNVSTITTTNLTSVTTTFYDGWSF